MRAIFSGAMPTTERPASLMSPWAGGCRPAMLRSVLDLLVPLWPTRQTISPSPSVSAQSSARWANFIQARMR